ncbi:hypothetical protein LTR53_009186 [Teratosphaeriaceae sp. CCFEE 6253]|nr:hypothetical protein LTR53_009186 [Teratosphaeriaceae sp. CCFEE 6253]
MDLARSVLFSIVLFLQGVGGSVGWSRHQGLVALPHRAWPRAFFSFRGPTTHTTNQRSARSLERQSRSWEQLVLERWAPYLPKYPKGQMPNGKACDAEFPALPPSRETSIHLPDDIASALHSSRHSTPPVPPGFEGHSRTASASVAATGTTTGRSTPTIPPGFAGKAAPSALPPHLDDDVPVSRPASRMGLRRQISSQQILPVVPLKPSRPSTPRLAAVELQQEVKTAVADLSTKGQEPATKGKEPATPVIENAAALSIAKPVAAEPQVGVAHAAKLAAPAEQSKAAEGSSIKPNKAEAHHSVAPETPTKSRPAAKVEPSQAPIVAAVVAKPRKSSAPMAVQPKGQATVQASDTKAAPVTPSKADARKDEKRKHPGKLDITAAVSKRDEVTATVSKAGAAETSTPRKPGRTVSQASTLKPESPSVASPLTKSAPRTLRVVQTPKAETPPPPSFPTPGLPTTGKLPSRQPSVASINPPGTPSSEQISISDNISIASTSHSRASSPPPGGAMSKIGTAPIREKTKSQLKKERQERSKTLDDAKTEGTVVAPIAEEPAQEAIVSRKKKSRREKEAKPRPATLVSAAVTGSAATTPTASRPPSPAPKPPAVEPVKERPVTPAKPSTPVKARPQSPQLKTPVQAPPPPMPSPHELSPPPTPTLTAASLLAELKSQAPELQKCIDSLFRTPTSTHFKPGQNLSSKDLHNPAFWKADFKINLTKDEVDALLTGTLPAINYGGQEGRVWDRGMITQSGSHLRALTEELEARFLDLEHALREMPEALRFRPGKPQNELKFPNVDLESLKRSFDNLAARGPSVMEQMVQDGSTMKKGAFLVDEASKYINEFVMPPATPPPSARAGQQQQATGGAAVTNGTEQPAAPSLEVAERQLLDARRVAEENEGRLKKLIKKNRKLLGLG